MRKFEHPVTPAVIEDALMRLCQELVPAAPSPVYVDCQFMRDAPARECFPLVAQQVEQNGGSVVYGWALWEMPGQFVEAEFHAVWRDPDGILLDISPKTEPTQRILFLKDPTRQYEGSQINNRRRAIRNDPVLEAFFQVCDKEFELLNRGERNKQSGMITLEGDEYTERQSILLEKMEYSMLLRESRPPMTAYSPCWCGSGKKNRWCHRDV